ncbi:phosphatase PAP2 family protein [Desulfitobacterium sp. PCE1]|uniref:phosphatase PAP2 family protein n=1 Tax=Desulfitobacterium sp. PCE1 TaxID=146907 RepID=UPI00037534A8|nr:phosphatase PAP2 family protein [Desulfitobacterium sp. PCE1]
MMQLFGKIDMNLLKLIHDYTQNALFDKAMPIITFLGDKGLIWIFIAVALIASKEYRKVGTMVICALLLSSILGEGLLKHLVQRPRPFTVVPAIQLLISKPLTYSFPSGHTASAFAAAGVLSKMMRKYRVYVVMLALLIAFSRMYLFVHYPADIIAGIMLGLICSKMIVYFFEFVNKRLNNKHEDKGSKGGINF